MKRYAIAGVVLVLLIASAYVFFSSSSGILQLSELRSSDTAAVPALTKEYKNEQYHFSLKMPDNFSPRDAGGILVLENTTGDGIQVSISPFDEDLRELTKERILQDVPDLVITEEQPVTIGPEHTGLAFKSDNEAFCAPPEPCAEGGDGASREVWFVFRGNLYQISTYERLDPLLKSIFSTWQFF